MHSAHTVSTKKFQLDEAFLEQYRGKQPKWGPLGHVVYKRTYARWIEEENRTEEWCETIQRNVEGNLNIILNDPLATQEYAQRMFDLMWRFCWLPPGRGLWMMGTKAAESVGSALFNCWHTEIRPKPYYPDGPVKQSTSFVFAMDKLMLGGGVGANISQEYVDKFPKVAQTVNLVIVCDPQHPNVRELHAEQIPPRNRSHTYVRVDDSRRGWTDAVRVIIDSAFKKTKYPRTVVLDMSDVREAGALIKLFGGTSAGPGPLVELLRHINQILNNRVGEKLTVEDCADIFNFIGVCVVSGNVRRSAELIIGGPCISKLKDNQERLMSHGWASNNSEIVDDEFDDYERLAKGITKNGEPGIVNLERCKNYGRFADGFIQDIDLQVSGLNPCLTYDTRLLTKEYGLMKIGDLAGETFSVYNANHEWQSSKAWFSGVKPVYKVTLTNGLEIEATGNHIVEAMRPYEKQLSEVPVSELEGCKIYPMIASSEWEGNDLLDEATTVFFGMILGDGYNDHGRVGFKNFEPEFVNFVQEYCELRNWEISTHANGAIRILSQELMNELNDFGIDLVPMPERQMPENVFHMTPDLIRSFLRGLYSANGSAQPKYNRIALKATSINLVKDTQRLLLALGFNAYTTTNKPTEIQWANGCYTSKQSYDLNVGSQLGYAKFQEQIGFLHSHKRKTNVITAYDCKPKATIVRSVEYIGDSPVYDFTEPDTHWSWANGLKVHNCGEATLYDHEPCCLAEIFPSVCWREGIDPHEAAMFATHYAKRVTFTDLSDCPAVQDVVNENHRIGPSISGWEDFKLVWASEGHSEQERHEWLDSMYKAVREADRAFSEAVGCEPSIKVTTVKPSGSIANLPGVSPGRHAHEAPYFIRRIRMGISDPLLQVLEDGGFHIEEDKYAPNTMCVEFPVKAPTADLPGFKSASDYTLEEQMQDQMELQTWWADQAVSSTLKFKPEEAKLIPDLLRKYKFKSTSLLPYQEHGYEQAPYEPISQKKYEKMLSQIEFWPHEAKTLQERESDLLDMDDCASGACPIR